MNESSPSKTAADSPAEALTLPSVLPLNVLAFDMGDARIGVAYKAASQSMALPIAVVPATPERHAFERLHRMIRDREVRMVVVGLPVHDDRTQADRIRKSVRRLRKDVRGVRWRFFDETLTSSAAADIARELGEGRHGRPDDDRAAALILESFLASLPKA